MDGLLGVSSPRAGPPSPASSAAGVTQRTPWRAVAAVSAVAAATAIALGASTASLWRSPPAAAAACGGGPAAVRQVEPPREVLGHDLDCAGGNYSATALKLVTELPVVRLLSNRPTGAGGGGGTAAAAAAAPVALSSFEVSDVAGAPGGSDVFAVFDNTFRIGHFYSGLSYEATAGGVEAGATGGGINRLLTWPGDNGTESQFEVLAYNASSSTFLIIQESIANASGSLVPRVMEVSLHNDTATVHATCDGALTFLSENKGFEGAAVATAADSTSYLLGLCEGNYCGSGDTGRTPGGGRLLVMARESTAGGGCAWVPHQTVGLPASANFMDYSAVSIFNNTRVAVASQENAAVWIGELALLDGARLSRDHPAWVEGSAETGEGGSTDGERALFGLSEGKVYDFPRNSQCQRIYCNVEGIHWQEPDVLVAVSDRMKSGGKQPFVCREHDQSIHTFLVPP